MTVKNDELAYCGKSMGISRFRNMLVAAVFLVSVTGCSTVSDWFADEDELEIRRLKPITEEFTSEVIWETTIGDGVDEYFSRLRPVFSYNKVFVAERHGEIAALEPDTGEPIWTRNFATFKQETWWDSIAKMWRSGTSAKISALASGYNLLYVGTEDGKLYALNIDNGETVWESSVAGEILAPPAYDEGILVVNTGSGVLFGLNATSGEQLWRSESDVPPLSLRGISAPLASNGGAIIGTANGKLQVNILESGIRAWDAAVTAPSGATELERIVDVDTAPIMFGGVIYTVSYNGSLAAIELRSGRVIWKREYGSYRNIAISGNQLYVVDNKSYVYALDRRNGVEVWSQSILKQRNLTTPLVMGDYLVVGDNYGFLHWLNSSDGKVVARLDLGGDDKDEAIYASPIRVGDKIVTMTRDGVAFAVTSPN
jgi:outer membrane protein assembly factor BamB